MIKSNSGNFEANSDKLSFDKDGNFLKLTGNVSVKNLESEGMSIEETSGDELIIFTLHSMLIIYLILFAF